MKSKSLKKPKSIRKSTPSKESRVNFLKAYKDWESNIKEDMKEQSKSNNALLNLEERRKAVREKLGLTDKKVDKAS